MKKGRRHYESKPRKNKIKDLIKHLHMNPKLPKERMTAPIQVVKVKRRMNRCEKAAIEPPSPLRNQLGNLVGHVGLCVGGFDIVQDPGTTALADEFPAQDTIFSEVHVGRENIRIRTVHRLAQKVLLQRTLPATIILQRNIPIRRKCPRKHRDVPKHTLQRLIQDIAHLVLEILGCDEWVDEIYAEFAFESDDLAAGTAYVGVYVEGFPEVVDGCGAGHSANVEQDTDVGLEDGAEGVEEPPVRIDLFLIFFFEAEDDLDWDDAAFVAFQFKSGSYGDLGTEDE